jgi:hypothetical protein
MRRSLSTRVGGVLIAACCGVAISLSPVFAAPAPSGFATGAVSGYRVSSVSYELAGDRVAAVSFDLDPPGARTARARLGSAQARCVVAGPRSSCRFDVPPSVSAVSSLEIVAAG